MLARILPYPRTHPDSTNFRYSHRFDPFPVFIGTVFRYSHGFYFIPVLARILLFCGTHPYSTIYRYSSGRFFDTPKDSSFSPYSPGFIHFSVLTQIRLFSGIRRDCFSILARILPLPGTRPDSAILRYSHRFDHIPVFVGKVFRYSQGL